MYENVRKPGWLRDVPSPLIRSLPAIYYFARFATDQTAPDIRAYFAAQIKYLADALQFMDSLIPDLSFQQSRDDFCRLINLSPPELLSQTEKSTRSLTTICSTAGNRLKELRHQISPELKQRYQQYVPPLSLLIMNAGESVRGEEKLRQTLSDYCQYDVAETPGVNDTLQQALLRSDCVIITSLRSPRLQQDIDLFDKYRRPAVIIIPRDERPLLTASDIRRAGQVSRQGIEILFYHLTPMRLYTTIEKTYMHDHLVRRSAGQRVKKVGII